MFSKAYELASNFTSPVIISLRFLDKSIQCGCGAFIILNEEGWIMTVAHVMQSYFILQKHQREIAKYHNQVQTIQQDQQLSIQQKTIEIARLKTNPKWITNNSFWWSDDKAVIKDVKALPEADFVVGRLEPFDSKLVKNYPVLKNPSKLGKGTSLCKLGFPFHDIQATFDEATNTFKLAPGALPIPRFPLEGIYTRDAHIGKSKDGKYEIKLLETSSPGLRGQSGGPIFDIEGTIWSVQSKTDHLPLGFSPKIVKEGKEVEEHQFLNVGLGIHPELMISFLKDNDIKFTMSKY